MSRIINCCHTVLVLSLIVVVVEVSGFYTLHPSQSISYHESNNRRIGNQLHQHNVVVPPGWTITRRSTIGSRLKLLHIDRSDDHDKNSNNMNQQQQKQQQQQEAFFMPSEQQERQQQQRHEEQEAYYKQIEFLDLEPLHVNEQRELRLQLEKQIMNQFIPFGDELWKLRIEMKHKSNELLHAIQNGPSIISSSSSTSESSSLSLSADDISRTKIRHYQYIQNLREQLQSMERQDPELVYRTSLLEYERLVQRQQQQNDLSSAIVTSDMIQYHKNLAKEARSCLPYYHLDGLWVGKYGNKYEMINVTYIDDILIATKLTGDDNVPAGEITFQVDFHPRSHTHLSQAQQNQNRPPPQQITSKGTVQEPPQQNQQPTTNNDNSPDSTGAGGAVHHDLYSTLSGLPPIQLTPNAAKKWGTQQLPRYGGLGQVASKDFTNHQWLQGQLIIIGSTYFSFAWVPIEEQIFFGRPSPELALKILRDHEQYQQQKKQKQQQNNEQEQVQLQNNNGSASSSSILDPSLSMLSKSSSNHNNKLDLTQDPKKKEQHSSSSNTALSSSNLKQQQQQLLQLQTEHLLRCYDKTIEVEEEYESENSFGGIWHSSSSHDSTDECYFE